MPSSKSCTSELGNKELDVTKTKEVSPTCPLPAFSMSMMVTTPGRHPSLSTVSFWEWEGKDFIPVRLLATVSPNIVRPFVMVFKRKTLHSQNTVTGRSYILELLSRDVFSFVVVSSNYRVRYLNLHQLTSVGM